MLPELLFRTKPHNYNIQTRNSTLGCLFVPSKRTTNYGLKFISQQAIDNWNRVTKDKMSDLLTYSRSELKSKIKVFYGTLPKLKIKLKINHHKIINKVIS